MSLIAGARSRRLPTCSASCASSRSSKRCCSSVSPARTEPPTWRDDGFMTAADVADSAIRHSCSVWETGHSRWADRQAPRCADAPRGAARRRSSLRLRTRAAGRSPRVVGLPAAASLRRLPGGGIDHRKTMRSGREPRRRRFTNRTHPGGESGFGCILVSATVRAFPHPPHLRGVADGPRSQPATPCRSFDASMISGRLRRPRSSAAGRVLR
jgi:hypothetical protein